MHTSSQKQQLREDITARIKRMTTLERSAESRTLCRELLPEIPEGSTICGYMPLATEADVRPLLLALLQRGNAVFLPCFEEETLAFRRAENLEDLHQGALRILEPPKDAAALDRADIVLVPGRAFDRAGHRLGRGNGGYDRWIAAERKRHPATRFIGVCLECQLVANVPYEEHDEVMDAVTTARGILSM